MRGRRALVAVLGVLVAIVCAWPAEAQAYFGPGAGMSAIGALLAIVVGILATIFGFLWYPIKRLLAYLRGRRATPGRGPDEPGADPPA
jgi:hypothetical protein